MTALYYIIRPLIPRFAQFKIRRFFAQTTFNKCKKTWPLSPSIQSKPPHGWKGWPHKKQFALVLMHDVDYQQGFDVIEKVIALENKYQFRSCFNIVPERYSIDNSIFKVIRENGFGSGVHGLKHDGKLFFSRSVFERRVKKINAYIDLWETKGFSSPSMHRNYSWMHLINSSYISSNFDYDPFEPQAGGVNSIFPVTIQMQSQKPLLELPYTLPQDSTLFLLLGQKDISVWKKKLDWNAESGGMVLVNCHPDYMNFSNKPDKFDQYPVRYYEEFLSYIQTHYCNKYWNALPDDVAQLWRDNYLHTLGGK